MCLKWRKGGICPPQQSSSSIWSLCYLHWHFPSLITEWNVSWQSNRYFLPLMLLLSLFCLARKCNIRGEVWIFTINFSSEKKVGGKLTINCFWQLLKEVISQSAGESRIWLLWNKTGKWGLGSREVDFVLAQEFKHGAVSPSQGDQHPFSVHGWRSVWKNQAAHQKCCDHPSQVSDDLWVTDSGKTSTGINCCCRPTKTERGECAGSNQGFWEAMRLGGTALSQSAHKALQASDN